MSLARPITFWIAAVAIGLAVLVVLRDIMLPFVAGMALAYLLDPVVRRLQRFGVRRSLSTLAIMALFMISTGALIVFTVPLIAADISAFVENLPTYMRRLQGFVTDPSRPWLGKLIGEGLRDADQSAAELTTLGVGFLRSLLSDGRTLFSIFSLLVVTPIVTFFLIQEWPRMLRAIDGGVPAAHREQVRALAHEVDETVSGFVRGQGLICLVLATFYALALSLVGLKHGVVIGVSSGLISFIPYLGSLSGVVVSVCMAIVQSWPDRTLIYEVIGVFFVGQCVADYILAPYLIGPRVKLNPVWLMFAMFAFGSIFGLVGLLIAVPMAAATGVLVRFGLGRYYASTVHTGGAVTPPAGSDPPAM